MDEAWRLTATRVSKYDPALRIDGVFIGNEWTCYSDVGRTFGGALLTFEEYEHVEHAYVRAVELFLRHVGCTTVSLSSIERNTAPGRFIDRDRFLCAAYERTVEGVEIPTTATGDVVRLILRNHLWCVLSSTAPDASVRFGWDFYMYFDTGTAGLDPTLTEAIEALGLHVG